VRVKGIAKLLVRLYYRQMPPHSLYLLPGCLMSLRAGLPIRTRLHRKLPEGIAVRRDMRDAQSNLRMSASVSYKANGQID
jgi:hypothetical protein